LTSLSYSSSKARNDGLCHNADQYFALNERVSMQDALASFTISAAQLYGMEDDKGSLVAGKLADMTILSGNPLTNNAANIPVIGTVARGVLHLASSKTTAPPAPATSAQ